MESISNEALAHRKSIVTISSHYINTHSWGMHFLHSANINGTQYPWHSILIALASFAWKSPDSKSKRINERLLPSEVKIKEREKGRQRKEETRLSHVHKPKHTSRPAQLAVNPSVGQGSSQLAWRPCGALHSIPSQLAVITSWIIIGPTHFPQIPLHSASREQPKHKTFLPVSPWASQPSQPREIPAKEMRPPDPLNFLAELSVPMP